MSRIPHDLCLTCFNSPVCMNVSRAGRPVFECEEFSQEVRPRSRTKYDALWPAPSDEGNSQPAEGLCCDCEHRHKCALQSVDGGIWHCEEYAPQRTSAPRKRRR